MSRPAADMNRLWPLGALLLSACAEPQFSFRGYTELSDCKNVLDAELDGGAVFEDVIQTEMPRGDGVATQLRGKLFSADVKIFVSCYDGGDVGAVDYIQEFTDSTASAVSFGRLTEELNAIFGMPQESGSENSHVRTYHCGAPATVILREARHGEMDFEVSLLVMPNPPPC